MSIILKIIDILGAAIIIGVVAYFVYGFTTQHPDVPISSGVYIQKEN